MKRIRPIDFPETEEEAAVWMPGLSYHAIHSKVLLVAKIRIEGKWSCYCTPVPGVSHDDETWMWQSYGTKTSETIARAAFPQFSEIPYAS